ncbi:transcription antitermination factor NusB [Aeoliella sp.]|uniref:transcription antitermination factor NusB n=1 Tax=Aeoliella sp. TaxID=2795800 RepID=UPI003CCBA853
MSRRSRAREVALQILFEDDVNPRDTVEALTSFVNARLNSPDMEEFCLSLILGVRRNQAEIDEALNAIAQNWTVNRMAATDRNVLRLGAFELKFTETPYKVVINEAVELAKRYGNANSAQFVNGILDKVRASDQPPEGGKDDSTQS